VICGESHDESFDLIYSVLSQLGSVREISPSIEGTGRHAFGAIGPDKTPVVLYLEIRSLLTSLPNYSFVR